MDIKEKAGETFGKNFIDALKERDMTVRNAVIDECKEVIVAWGTAVDHSESIVEELESLKQNNAIII